MVSESTTPLSSRAEYCRSEHSSSCPTCRETGYLSGTRTCTGIWWVVSSLVLMGIAYAFVQGLISKEHLTRLCSRVKIGWKHWKLSRRSGHLSSRGNRTSLRIIMLFHRVSWINYKRQQNQTVHVVYINYWFPPNLALLRLGMLMPVGIAGI